LLARKKINHEGHEAHEGERHEEKRMISLSRGACGCPADHPRPFFFFVFFFFVPFVAFVVDLSSFFCCFSRWPLKEPRFDSNPANTTHTAGAV
jgi:hypothetical protein